MREIIILTWECFFSCFLSFQLYFQVSLIEELLEDYFFWRCNSSCSIFVWHNFFSSISTYICTFGCLYFVSISWGSAFLLAFGSWGFFQFHSTGWLSIWTLWGFTKVESLSIVDLNFILGFLSCVLPFFLPSLKCQYEFLDSCFFEFVTSRNWNWLRGSDSVKDYLGCLFLQGGLSQFWSVNLEKKKVKIRVSFIWSILYFFNQFFWY